MVEITKREAEYLRKVIPGVHITRTVHHWYAEEIKSVLTQLPGNPEAEEALRELNRTQRTNTNFEILGGAWTNLRKRTARPLMNI